MGGSLTSLSSGGAGGGDEVFGVTSCDSPFAAGPASTSAWGARTVGAAALALEEGLRLSSRTDMFHQLLAALILSRIHVLRPSLIRCDVLSSNCCHLDCRRPAKWRVATRVKRQVARGRGGKSRDVANPARRSKARKARRSRGPASRAPICPPMPHGCSAGQRGTTRGGGRKDDKPAAAKRRSTVPSDDRHSRKSSPSWPRIRRLPTRIRPVANGIRFRPRAVRGIVCHLKTPGMGGRKETKLPRARRIKASPMSQRCPILQPLRWRASR